MSTMISRVGFCPRCYKEGRPKTAQPFVVVGKNFHVLEASHIGKQGFTPHFYVLIKSIGENIVFEKLCGMHRCGVDIWWDKTNQKHCFTLDKYKFDRGIMTLKDWNSLVLYKHDFDYEI